MKDLPILFFFGQIFLWIGIAVIVDQSWLVGVGFFIGLGNYWLLKWLEKHTHKWNIDECVSCGEERYL